MVAICRRPVRSYHYVVEIVLIACIMVFVNAYTDSGANLRVAVGL
jgi:hypothetical protein